MSEQKRLQPDTVLKAYWRDDARFADLFNQVLFDGDELISPEELTDGDTDEADMFLEKRTVISISRLRDLLKRYGPDVVLALFSIENQMSVHYAMPVRTMLSDALRYSKQCKTFEQDHRQHMDLEAGAEFLSGMAQTDRIVPVLTLVIYYGEDAWNGPDTLWDMMDIPEALKPYINNYRIHIFQVKDCQKYSFKNSDNKDFFMLISEFYKAKGPLKIKDFQEKYPDKTFYWETVAAVGAATGTKKLINYALNHKGERINMCRALQGMIDEGRNAGLREGFNSGLNEGRSEGLREAITETVRILKELNIPESIILSKLKENFHLSQNEIGKYMN